MKTNIPFWFGGSAVVIALTLGGCSDGGGGFFSSATPAPATAVPDSAGASGASFVAFIMGLALGDETSEPLTFSTTFPATPEDNTGDPVPLA